MKTRSLLLGVSLCAASPLAVADDTSDKTMKKDTSSANRKDMKDDVTKPKLGTEQVMKITQQAVSEIAAAQNALARNDKAAAKAALGRSEKALAKLYDTPALAAALNEIDEAIRSVTTGKNNLQVLDLAPISASLQSYQAYMDPEIAAGLATAKERAQKNDPKGTEEALRLVRDRVALEVALLPVEEAYVRVLAAQQALTTDDPKTAQRLLGNVPIIVSEVQVSRPLVPMRFKLQAAAEAAESGNWQRAQTLVKEANRDAQQLEKLAASSQFKSELTTLQDDLERLDKQMGQTNNRPGAKEIRELAARTRTIGDDDRMNRDRG